MPPDVTPQGGRDITFRVFLPKMFNLNLTIGKPSSDKTK